MEIVAEISGNHGGKIENAYRLIKAATKAGADSVKFQCFEPEQIAIRRIKHPALRNYVPPGGISLLDLYRKTHTPKKWFPSLIHAAGEHGLNWFSSVFDPADVAFLETLDCPRYKTSAYEMRAWDIMKAIEETGKEHIMSVRPTEGVILLHATDYYGNFTPLGISAHGDIADFCGPDGVPMIECHLKLDGVETPDDAFSLSPASFEKMVARIRKG